jgi:hypothetical protein
MVSPRGYQDKRTFFWEKGVVDLRKLSWFEIHNELQKSDPKVSKLALLRQLAENYWNGRYKNHEKKEVENFLCGFLNDQTAASILGCGFMEKDVRQNKIKEIELIVFSFLSRSKIKGRIKVIVKEFGEQLPNKDCINGVNQIIANSHL